MAAAASGGSASGFLDGGGMGGRAFGMGRKLASVDLQLLILRLLADKAAPRLRNHQGVGRASPRVLRAEPGHGLPGPDVSRGARTRDGRGGRQSQALPHHRRRPAVLGRAPRQPPKRCLHNSRASAERMERVRRALNLEEAGEDSASEPERSGSKDLMRARRELKAALAAGWNSSPAEQARIAEILRRAAAEILGKETRK